MRLVDIDIPCARGIGSLVLCSAFTVALAGCSGSVPVQSQTAVPTLTLTGSPASIGEGASSMLNWSAANASSCSASGGWSGSEPTSGSASTGPLSVGTTYTLTCTGAGGSASQSVTVNVTSTTVAGPSCSATSGGLTLRASAVRAAGISPLLVFFDTTAGSNAYPSAGSSTDTATLGGANNAIQDVSYSWNFGDTGASGTGTWAYGSNAGHNSKNTATGPVAAHLYVTNGSDTSYTATVTAYDGTNTASCQIGVTVSDPVGANGFPGSATTCVSATTMPVADFGGCPAGAAVMQQSNIGSALSAALGAKKRVLFRCGDSFSGTYSTGANTESIGAYGGCEGTTSGRPIFSNSSGKTLNIASNDVRVADIDFEDSAKGSQAIDTGTQSQVTVYNTKCSNANGCYHSGNTTQTGFIAAVQTSQVSIGTFPNYGGSVCVNGYQQSGSFNGSYCNVQSTYSQSLYHNISYNAIIGGSFDGTGAGGGAETMRVGVCRLCVISNNTIKNSAPGTSVLKFHEGHYNGSNDPWDGQYSEINEVSDNLFTGTSGGYLTSYAPQNTTADERLRYGIFERNMWVLTNGQGTGPLVSASFTTHRNNVIYSTSTDTPTVAYGIYHQRQGAEPMETSNENYNNTCYGLEAFTGPCVQINVNNSFAANNLFYTVGGANIATAGSGGTGNTISNNTAASTVTFSPMNGSGTLGVITDFMPAQNYTGGTSVPAWYDGRGVAWSPTWNLGAIKP